MINRIIKHISQLSFKRSIDLNKSQWWALGKLEEFQNKRLRKIIKYAYENIPGYREKNRKISRINY